MHWCWCWIWNQIRTQYQPIPKAQVLASDWQSQISNFDQSLEIADQTESQCFNLFWSGASKNIYSAEDQDSAHLFMPRMWRGIHIAIKTRALERCREMDLHPNSLRVLALTLLRIGSESNSRKSSLLNCKPQYFNGYCKLSVNAQLRLCTWCYNTPNNRFHWTVEWTFIVPVIHQCNEVDLQTHTHTHIRTHKHKSM